MQRTYKTVTVLLMKKKIAPVPFVGSPVEAKSPSNFLDESGRAMETPAALLCHFLGKLVWPVSNWIDSAIPSDEQQIKESRNDCQSLPSSSTSRVFVGKFSPK